MNLFASLTMSRFSTLFISIALASIFTGCKGDGPQEPSQSDPAVTFTITLSSESQGSRASSVSDYTPDSDPDWDHNTNPEAGTDFDRTVNSIAAVLYYVDDDDKLVTSSPAGELTDPEYRHSGEGNLVITGRLKTSLDAESLRKGNFRLAVFVNSPEVDPTKPGEAYFTRHGVPGKELMTGIPMYGVGKADFSDLADDLNSKDSPYEIKGGNKTDRLHIPMLRAMAKIRVKVNNELFTKRGMKLSSISISRHAPGGFVVPSQWNVKESMSILGMSESMNAIRPDTDEGYTHECKVKPSVEKPTYEQNSWTMLRCYIPETYNCDHDNIDTTKELCLSVEYFTDENEPKAKENKIYFRPYKSDGQPDRSEGVKPWDLIRNHIYEFTITGIAPRTGELLVTVETDWWGEHQLDLE